MAFVITRLNLPGGSTLQCGSSRGWLHLLHCDLIPLKINRQNSVAVHLRLCTRDSYRGFLRYERAVRVICHRWQFQSAGRHTPPADRVRFGRRNLVGIWHGSSNTARQTFPSPLRRARYPLPWQPWRQRTSSLRLFWLVERRAGWASRQ